MSAKISSHLKALTVVIGSVWIFHGLYSKILGGIPRHQQIVGRILGEEIAEPATVVIGLMEIGMGMWIFSGKYRKLSAGMQSLALVSMNVLEIKLANDLLVSAVGMVALNMLFLSMIWYWAMAERSAKV